MENLFSYGTLQSESVQLSTFGRKLEGHPDFLVGYMLSFIKIEDEAVIASSGMAEHPIIKYTNNPNDTISGTVFTITKEELFQADKYEVGDYKRIEIVLRSGQKAWVFISAEKNSKS